MDVELSPIPSACCGVCVCVCGVVCSVETRLFGGCGVQSLPSACCGGCVVWCVVWRLDYWVDVEFSPPTCCGGGCDVY